MSPDTSPPQKRPVTALAALGGLAAVTILGGITQFGIWDPWELQVADQANAISAGKSAFTLDPRGAGLSGLAFMALGTREWVGRLPGALLGLLALVATVGIARRGESRDRSLVAGIILLSLPAFIFNTVPMGGHVGGIAMQAVTMWLALVALDATRTAGQRVAVALGALVAATLAASAHGALVGALPPLVAVATIGLWTGVQTGPQDRAGRPARAILLAGSSIVVSGVCYAVVRDSAGHELWTGGAPQGTSPPAFDLVIERAFHSLAPWSAFLPLALAWAVGQVDHRHAQSIRNRAHVACALWCLAGYGAQTVYLARYGSEATFLPVAAVAVLCAALLSDTLDGKLSPAVVAIPGTLLCLLVLRDFALFPSAPLEALPTPDFTIPAVFNPKTAWVVLIGSLCLAVVFTIREPPAGHANLGLATPYTRLWSLTRRSIRNRLLGGLAALGVLTLCLLSVTAWLTDWPVGLSSLGRKAIKGSGLVLVAVPTLFAIAQTAWWGTGRLGSFRILPPLVASGAFSLYLAYGFLPELSAHLSPREVYETFNKLARKGAGLAEFGVGDAAANYYVSGPVESVSDIGRLAAYLEGTKPKWAVIRTKDLASVDGRFREKTGRHLVVADARSARVLLVTNQPRQDIANSNRLSTIVLDQAPDDLGEQVQAQFGDVLELLGYKLTPGSRPTVGPGETFSITWYFRVKKRQYTDYKVFVHIDGEGNRIHGDHQPADGGYPMHLWRVGDVIADQHEISVPASSRVGDYQIFMGFYKGDRRLPVKVGPQDGVDRLKAGVLRIR